MSIILIIYTLQVKSPWVFAVVLWMCTVDLAGQGQNCEREQSHLQSTGLSWTAFWPAEPGAAAPPPPVSGREALLPPDHYQLPPHTAYRKKKKKKKQG